MPVDDAAYAQAFVDSWWFALLRAILVAAAAYIGLRLALHWSTRAMVRAHIDLGTQILVRRALIVGFIVLAGLSVLGLLGVSPTGIITIAGAVGLAFSLAIQDILKNFFSGIYLLLERPFRVGDTIRVKEQQGIVENIGVRTTKLRTRQNVQVLVPNAVVFAEVVSNHSQEEPPTAAAGEPEPRATPAAEPANPDPEPKRG
jgi:small conductance mechanosensitive channel